MRILTVIGTRPQIIKASVVSKQFVQSGIDEIVLHTGQHYDTNMSSQFFEELELPYPSINLNIHHLGHSAMTGRMIESIADSIKKTAPDAVLVYGDCNSTLAGAIAAKQAKKKLIHIEAGLRSHRQDMPEELNRVIVDRISDYLFCPTQLAMQNLQKEGFEHLNADVVLSGDVMEDAALTFSATADQKSNLFERHPEFQKGQYILCTIHREENIYSQKKLIAIAAAIHELSKSWQVIIPLHPATRQQLQQFNLTLDAYLTSPLGYLDMNLLVRHAKLVMTDSGGLQKEAFFFNKFCITLREETEWKELVEGGYNRLAGTNPDTITVAAREFEKKNFVKRYPYFGGGQAAKAIIKHLQKSEVFSQ